MPPVASMKRVVARMQQGSATPTTDMTISLGLLGGDVWSWTKHITGTCPGLPVDATVSISVNGHLVLAERDGDAFSAEVSLQPGANEVAAVALLADGAEIRSEPATHTVRLSPRPTSRIVANVADGQVTLDGTSSMPSEYDGAAIVCWGWTQRDDNPIGLSLAPAAATPDGLSVVVTGVPAMDGEYYVSLEVADAEGRTDTSTACIDVENGVARAMEPVVDEAAWISSAAVYGMVVRNFTSDGFNGVTERLDELASLGVTALWFAPITCTNGDSFGYDVTDYFALRPEYGTLADFRTLVDEAHARDIRVLMDFVPNHTSVNHPYFRHAEEWGEASPYYDFYDRDSDGKPTHYFNWDHLPNLNFENHEVRRFMTEAFSYWVRELDVDGFRVDVAWGIKERRPDYWLEWSSELNRMKPDLLLIAEASARDPFYVQNGFDASYDWTDELGVWAWNDVFADGHPLSKALTGALTADGEGYDPDSLILRFLNNNDTGERFISVHGVDRYRAAMTILMTLPGIPCLFTGDEVGAAFKPYKDTGDIDWSDPNGLRPFVTRLIRLRHGYPAFQSREWRQIEVEPAVEMFGYLRPSPDGGSIGVVLNYSPNDLETAITLPPELMGSRLVDLWTGERIPAPSGSSLSLSIPAWSCRILHPEPPVA